MRKLLTLLLAVAAPAGIAPIGLVPGGAALAADQIVAPPMPMTVLSTPACAAAAPLVLGSLRNLPREVGTRRPAAPPTHSASEPEEEATLRPAFQLCIPSGAAARPVYRT
ncbi:hypothetical protein LPC08_16555 [Roseomonas sp. OT10]|uniref:hypothetical protein n=1 Tax=Roseomonas cutis TaxID=2897332 RepID=UPI001E62DCE3|nr:hypothetical protein [Roseomonas sp. OT10]UFN47617.1 hypothetical protein LPC08_16555 [Roseomonas sp. OT10]